MKVFFVDLVFTVVHFVALALVHALCIPLSVPLFLWERYHSSKSAPKSRRPKSILITGGSSGIGEALALEYARANKGCFLALTGRDEGRLAPVAAACRELGATVETIQADVSDQEKMAKIIEDLDTRHPIDLVVANAGIASTTLKASGVVEKVVKPIFDINVYGVFNTVLPLIPRMRTRKTGQIAIVSSVASFVSSGSSVSYSSSKFAVRAWGEGLRALLSVDNIGVSIVCPGFVRSAMTAPMTKKGMKLPFFIESDDAARRIRDGLERNHGIIAFPRIMYILTSVFGSIPAPIRDAFLAAVSKPTRFEKST